MLSRLLRHPLRKERGAILLFCPGHHTRGETILCKLLIIILSLESLHLLKKNYIIVIVLHYVMIMINCDFYELCNLPNIINSKEIL
jgi:hypothetical protein